MPLHLSTYSSFFFFCFLFCFLIHPAFPARTTPPSQQQQQQGVVVGGGTEQPLTITIDDSNSTTAITPAWHNFVKFVDTEKGSSVTGIAELKKYFHRFGYLSTSIPPYNATAANTRKTPPPTALNFTDIFDSQLESAIILYQQSLGLPVTGKLDSETVTHVVSPRCGVSDSNSLAASALHTTKRYAYFYGHPRWTEESPMTLTYAFSEKHMIHSLDPAEIMAVFRRAFSRWSDVIPVNFTQTDDYSSAEIKIGFYRGDHGDGEPFDGVLGILAHAFSPENGRFHLDAAETWAVDFEKQGSKVAVDLESVATHEIGHILGLGHSKVKEAIMYPSLRPRTRKLELKVDDVEGVQALYGSNPNFKFSSLLESYRSENNGAGLRFGWWIGLMGLLNLSIVLL